MQWKKTQDRIEMQKYRRQEHTFVNFKFQSQTGRSWMRIKRKYKKYNQILSVNYKLLNSKDLVMKQVGK